MIPITNRNKVILEIRNLAMDIKSIPKDSWESVPDAYQRDLITARNILKQLSGMSKITK